ncbi:hypothetical protein AHOG_16385 [Actinoalloteichus hoggarensis]|uniref:Uncharacterized protein n=1 Tax=Actinoalloteichus hoggarensis TaxID=1470176 RepID=A0A221W585_9PSEU|nr:hypothetical protein AHOG_16385 [Actinoalloteichus hoggarensis]
MTSSSSPGPTTSRRLRSPTHLALRLISLVGTRGAGARGARPVGVAISDRVIGRSALGLSVHVGGGCRMHCGDARPIAIIAGRPHGGSTAITELPASVGDDVDQPPRARCTTTCGGRRGRRRSDGVESVRRSRPGRRPNLTCAAAGCARTAVQSAPEPPCRSSPNRRTGARSLESPQATPEPPCKSCLTRRAVEPEPPCGPRSQAGSPGEQGRERRDAHRPEPRRDPPTIGRRTRAAASDRLVGHGIGAGRWRTVFRSQSSPVAAHAAPGHVSATTSTTSSTITAPTIPNANRNGLRSAAGTMPG